MFLFLWHILNIWNNQKKVLMEIIARAQIARARKKIRYFFNNKKHNHKVIGINLFVLRSNRVKNTLPYAPKGITTYLLVFFAFLHWKWGIFFLKKSIFFGREHRVGHINAFAARWKSLKKIPLLYTRGSKNVC